MNQSTKPSRSIVLHGFALSGHSHRVELFLSLLGLPYQAIEIDLRSGAHKSAEFLKMNAFGQVPVIDDDGLILADSNAILVYLAARYGASSWYPQEPVQLARIQRWLSVAAGPIAFGPALARRIALFTPSVDAQDAIQRANALFALMDQELARQDYLAGDAPTIADIANYSYVASAPDGHVSLESFAHLRAWLARIEALPGFVPMPSRSRQQEKTS